MNEWTGKILKPGIAGSGYRLVVLCNNEGRINKKVHRLVANAFLSKVDDDKNDVDHIDRNKSNN